MTDIHLFPPEPDIDLYKDGFEKLETLKRDHQGQQLSDLLDKTSDSFTLAVDGVWGTGKTIFLKAWIGHHIQNSKHSPTMVYFDAFEHDYQDDPLIALTAAITKRLNQMRDEEENVEGQESEPSFAHKTWAKALAAAPTLGRIAFRSAVSIGTAGFVNKADQWVDNAKESIADELLEAGAESLADELKTASETFWKAETQKQTAMEMFREGLTALTEPDANGKPSKRLILVIDELDRCRPDYALNMLETLKHVFAIPGVQFVLGVNMEALANSVKARYGADYDAALYLQKFVQITTNLKTSEETAHRELARFFLYERDRMGIKSSDLLEIIADVVSINQNKNQITLRGIQLLLRLSATTPTPEQPRDRFGQRDPQKDYLLAGLLIFKAFEPELLIKLRGRSINWYEVRYVLGLVDPSSEHWYGKSFSLPWYLCFPDQLSHETWQELLGGDLTETMANINYDTLIYLLDNYVDAFELT